MSSAISIPHLTIIIPAYNESSKIETDIRAAQSFLQSQSYSIEVIVVDDGSRDATAERVRNLQPGFPQLRLISYQPNRGKGYAVKSGVLASRGETVLFVDAGLCVPYAEVQKGLALLQQGWDVALGSRKIPGAEVRRPQHGYRRAGSALFGFFVRNCMGVGSVRDTQCGFKFYSARAAKEIFTRVKIDGFMFDIEAILIARRLGLKMTEFSIEWHADHDSRFKPLTGSLRNFKELWQIRFSSYR